MLIALFLFDVLKVAYIVSEFVVYKIEYNKWQKSETEDLQRLQLILIILLQPTKLKYLDNSP